MFCLVQFVHDAMRVEIIKSTNIETVEPTPLPFAVCELRPEEWKRNPDQILWVIDREHQLNTFGTGIFTNIDAWRPVVVKDMAGEVYP